MIFYVFVLSSRKTIHMPQYSTGCVLVFVLLATAIYAQSPQEAPSARQVEHISVWHGEKVNDPFFWLREKSNPEVIKYLEAENAYTEAMTKDSSPLPTPCTRKCSATSSKPI